MKKSAFIFLLLLILSSALSGNENPFLLNQSNNGNASSAGSQSLFNPLISVIGDILFYNSDIDDSIYENGLDIREIELSFSATVDVFAKADFCFGIHREAEEESEEAEHSEESGHAAHYALHLEEGYITFLALPASFQIKAGKMLAAIGKANPNHLHNLNWYDYPAAIQTYFGDHGLAGTGFEINVLPPLPFYCELKYQLLRDESGAYFSTHDDSKWFHNFQLKNFFQLGDDHSLEIDLDYMFVPSKHEHNSGEEEILDAVLPDENDETGEDADDFTHSLVNIALYYVWQPTAYAKERKLTVSSELFFFDSTLDDYQSSKAFYAAVDYKFDLKWAAGLRWDYVESPYKPDISENQYTVNLTYLQSEYAFLRGGYTYVSGAESDENRLFVQLNFGIGPHRAHSF